MAVFGGGLDPVAQGDTVDARHHDVADNQVNPLALNQLQRIFAVGGHKDVILFRQFFSEISPHFRIVFHYEDGVEKIVDGGGRFFGLLFLAGGRNLHHGFLMDGQFQDEGVEILYGTVQGEGAPVENCQAAGIGESETGTLALASRTSLVEFLEDLVRVIVRDAVTVTVHADTDALAVRQWLQADADVAVSVFAGVRDQVSDNLVHHFPGAVHHERSLRE